MRYKPEFSDEKVEGPETNELDIACLKIIFSSCIRLKLTRKAMQQQ